MKLFIDDSEIQELTIGSILESSRDYGIVVESQVGKRHEGISTLQKEIIAMDALDVGVSVAAKINDLGTSSVSKYKDGKDISDDDSRSRILGIKHQISDMATAKLMDTLNLFNPSAMVKPREII